MIGEYGNKNMGENFEQTIAVAEIIIKDYSGGWQGNYDNPEKKASRYKFDYKAIAEELGITADAVRYRWRSAQKFLKNILNKR